MGGFWPTTLVDVASVAESIATVVAVACGAAWFWRRRQQLPWASTEHEVVCRTLPNNRMLVRVTVRIANLGNVLLRLNAADVWLQCVDPCPEAKDWSTEHAKDGELPWPTIGTAAPLAHQPEVEPNETEELYYDFVVDNNQTKAILVNSYVKNMAKKQLGFINARSREIGWNRTTLHRIDLTAS